MPAINQVRKLETTIKPWPSSSMMGYSPIAKNVPLIKRGKYMGNINGIIRSIYPIGTNYHNLLLYYGET